MSEKEYIIKDLKLRYVGIFDFADLYKKMKGWLEFNGYGDALKNFKEEKYVERVKPDGKQIEIAWVGKREVSDYFNNIIEVTFFVIGLQKVDVEEDGKKIGTNKGDIELKFNAYLVKDSKNKFHDRPFVRRIYEKYLIKDAIEQYKIDLYTKANGFYDEVRSYLNIKQV